MDKEFEFLKKFSLGDYRSGKLDSYGRLLNVTETIDAMENVAENYDKGFDGLGNLFGDVFNGRQVLTSTEIHSVPRKGFTLSGGLYVPFGFGAFYRERNMSFLKKHGLIKVLFPGKSLNCLARLLRGNKLWLDMLKEPGEDSGKEWMGNIYFDMDYAGDFMGLNIAGPKDVSEYAGFFNRKPQ